MVKNSFIGAAIIVLAAGLSACRGAPSDNHPVAAETPTAQSATPSPQGTEAPCPRDTALNYVDGMVQPVLRKKVDVPFTVEESRKHAFKGGRFEFELVVTKDGRACGIKTLKAPEFDPPWPELEKIQRDAVSRSEWEPATLNGQPVDVLLDITVRIEVRR
jgi:hypothetical protein